MASRQRDGEGRCNDRSVNYLEGASDLSIRGEHPSMHPSKIAPMRDLHPRVRTNQHRRRFKESLTFYATREREALISLSPVFPPKSRSWKRLFRGGNRSPRRDYIPKSDSRISMSIVSSWVSMIWLWGRWISDRLVACQMVAVSLNILRGSAFAEIGIKVILEIHI